MARALNEKKSRRLCRRRRCLVHRHSDGLAEKKIVDEYRSIFQEAGYPNPIIVPESNAAMVHAQKSYGAMARVNPEIGALCMDFGAYSNDATYILPGKVSSCGGYTGAALIEQMLLRINMQQRCKLSKSCTTRRSWWRRCRANMRRTPISAGI